MQIKYRKDIDGLRAVAVMGVLFYHLDFNLFPGGFTGVDIFFVISGFLISSIIVQEIGSRKFSFAAFYERRIRRILPAYFFLLICTSIGSYLIYAPETMVQYGRAMRYTLVFISNNLFAREVNYFDKSFNDSPLLHTWTLSVEEQFYLIWPVILVFAAKYLSQRKFNLFFILLLTSSLAASEILLFTQARLSFYMLYSRAWELGAGALLALPIFPEIQSKRKVELFSSIGLLGLLISFFLLSDTTRFPGLYATFSVIGTSLIIYSGRGQHKSHVHRLLSHRPFLYIGLISYSLYLWHWPLITFTKYYLNRSLNLTESFFIIFTSLLVSFFSYRFVETPFRKKKKHLANGHKKSQKKIFIVTALTIIAFVQLAKTIEKTGGFPSRFSEINQTELYDGNPQRKNCHLSQSETIPKNKAICSRDYGQKKALIWGDSHADHYSPALDEWARKNEISLRQISKSDCVPMVGNFDIYLLKDKKRYEKYTSCHTFNENILQLIEEDSIDIVVIGGRWSGYLPADTEPGLYLLDGSHSTPSKAATESIFKEKFTQMVDILVKRNIQVILLGQVPIFAENPVECYFNNITPIKKYFRKTSETGAGCEMTRDEIDREVNNAHSFFRQLAKQNGVQFFDPLDEICDKDNCSALQKDKIIYHDTHHLNKAGSDFLKKPLAQKLAP